LLEHTARWAVDTLPAGAGAGSEAVDTLIRGLAGGVDVAVAAEFGIKGNRDRASEWWQGGIFGQWLKRFTTITGPIDPAVGITDQDSLIQFVVRGQGY
jgi:hypothetical protein